MTITELIDWHQKQAIRHRCLSQDEESNLPAVYKASRRRSLGRIADFHTAAVAALQALAGQRG